jgi:hypothetical protein
VNIQDNMANKINKDLERFTSLLGYNPQKGNQINEAKMRRPAPGYLTEEEPEEESEETEGGEEEFDFGGEETEETEGGGDFDFGDEGSPEDEEETEIEDEFGTADEFSAADELESVEDDEVEEIDVTAIVKGSDEAKEMAQQAVTVGQENMTYLKSLTDKLTNLEAQLSKMDSIASKIGKLEQDIKTPEERLELRSLDSYPFNMKLSDYWEEKASKDSRYRISSGEEVSDRAKKEYVLTQDELDSDYSEEEIKNSFMPESKSKKKTLTEGDKEQMDARTRIESILSQLDTEDRKVVEQDLVKNLSRGYVTKQQSLKNIKK